MRSMVRRISGERMLALIKACLEMLVEEDEGQGGKRLNNLPRKERKESPILPVLSGLYMRRFVLSWRVLGLWPALSIGDRELC